MNDTRYVSYKQNFLLTLTYLLSEILGLKFSHIRGKMESVRTLSQWLCFVLVLNGPVTF